MRWWAAVLAVLCLVAGCASVEQAGDEPRTRDRSGTRADATNDARPAQRTERERRSDAPRDRRERRDRRSTDQDARPEPAPAGRTFLVTRVVDGDTIELGNGETVRLVGIDTPEVGTCGFERAAARLGELVLGRQVRLAESDEDRDGYGRLLRYVDVGRTDSGLQLIREGLAIARYDSRDGYGFHPREPRYVAEDKGSRPVCAPAPQPLLQQPPKGGGCAPGYAPCVPPYPPDVDCADVDGPVRVTGSDPHGLDGEGDGIACE